MPKISDATYRVGATAASALYLGPTLLWPTSTPPALRAGSASGTATGTSATITLPSGWQASDYLTLIVSTNQAPTLGFSAGVASFTVLSSAGSRLQAIRIVPNPGATTVTMTASVSAVLTWWVGAWQNVDPNTTVAQAAINYGNDTTSAIAAPVVDLGGYIASGHEVWVSAAGVNASATWATTSATLYATTAGNAALSVQSGPVAAGAISEAAPAFDRGNDTSARNESALALVLQPVQTTTKTLLTNGSFETFASGVATGWSTEGNTASPVTYAQTTSGVVDGASAWSISYTGTASDSNTKFEPYQSPIAVNPGDTVTFSVWLSGSLTSLYGFIGIEGFVTAGGAYISEQDTNFLALTSTPTQYTVTYTCPANCTAVAVYMQVPSITSGTSATVIMDKATLVKN
jgi:hypothetical protein